MFWLYKTCSLLYCVLQLCGFVFNLSFSQVMELCRPSDSHLEHVDFECLFSCLSLRLLLRVFGSLLLERRVIFTADKLRLVATVALSILLLHSIQADIGDFF